MTVISIIAVIGKNRELGKDNKLLWSLPEDLKHFKKITLGHPVIMGRKTFESIGKPLQGRTNIIITRNKSFKADGCMIAGSITVALKKAGKGEIFIIGGGEIYSQSISLADKLYLTVVNDSPEADTYFPDYSDFKKISGENFKAGELECSFLELVRNQ